VHEDEELEPEVLTYREFHRQRTLVDWYERRRLYECGRTANTGVGGFAALRNAVAEWALDFAWRSSGRSPFRRSV
jgi:hypothetical protein